MGTSGGALLCSLCFLLLCSFSCGFVSMSATYFLPKLGTKREVDQAIKETEDLVLVLRFGKEADRTTSQLDEILLKTIQDLGNMAKIYTVDVRQVPVYTHYFDVSLIPATIFFFNGQHIKVDYGTQDNTKLIGSLRCKQDFIDLVEVIYRGAMKGKMIVQSPLDPVDLAKYQLYFNDV